MPYRYDLFISYARRDNDRGQVTALKEQIAADYQAFAGEELRCFFDESEIKGMDDWRQRLLGALQGSHLLLLVLSPGYLASDYCQWEVVEYLKYVHARAVGGEGVAPVYFVEIPGLDSSDFMAQADQWVKQARCYNHFDLRPWYDEGRQALQRREVQARLTELKQALQQRLTRLRRAAAAPGNLPAGNPHFVGRVEEMRRLHEATATGQLGLITALHGLGGLGKTALALQYAYAYADFYPGGRWLLNCVGAQQLAGLIRRLHVDLGVELTEAEALDDDLAARRVLQELEDRAENNAATWARAGKHPKPQALLILDNVEQPAWLQPPESHLISGREWLRVLATTRRTPAELGADPRRFAVQEVDRLPEADALSLLESYQPRGRFADQAERQAAREIVRLLDGFTLAVEVVAVYLGEQAGAVTCAGYEQWLRQEGLAALEDTARVAKGGLLHGEKLLGATLQPTLALLSPAETLLLQYASLLPPDSVPLPWLRTLAGRHYPELLSEDRPGRVNPWLTAVNRLLGLRLGQLVETAADGRTPRLVRVHRLVQELVRQGMAPEDIAAHQAALRDLVRARDAALKQTSQWTAARWEVAPLEALAWLWDEQGHDGAAWLLNQVGQRWHHLAEWPRAEGVMRRALAIDEASLGPEHTHVAIRLNNLAGLLRATNRLAEAEPLYRRALAIWEQNLGPDHPNVARGLNNLAELLYATNRLAEAEPLYRRALAMDEKSFGPDHPNVARNLNNLAGLFYATNRFSEAEPLFRRSLAIDEASYGPEHPDVATALNNLALLLRSMGRFSEAEPLYRRALAIDEASFGPEHPTVAISLNNLAALLRATNRLAEAEPLFRRSLAIDEASYGPEHPDVSRDLNNLAGLLKDTNRLSEAEPLYRRALAIDEASYGPDHPDVARDLNNLALLLRSMGRFSEAEPLYRRALAIDEASFGPEQPTVAIRLNNLALLLQATNRLAEAEPLYRRALAIYEKSFGPDHPKVATALNNLAELLRATNRLSEAEQLYRRALAIDEASFGPDHPNVAIDLNNLALLFKATNRLAEAEPLYRRALAIFFLFYRRTGHQHPYFETVKNNYARLLQAMGLSETEVEARLQSLVQEVQGGGESV